MTIFQLTLILQDDRWCAKGPGLLTYGGTPGEALLEAGKQLLEIEADEKYSRENPYHFSTPEMTKEEAKDLVDWLYEGGNDFEGY